MNNFILKIKDIHKEDAGKGIIRIDPDIAKDYNLRPDDIIEITYPKHNRKAAGILRLSKKKDEVSYIIRVGPSIRKSLKAPIDGVVEIRKIEAVLAKKVRFKCHNPDILLRESQWFANRLENRIITPRNIIIFYDWGRSFELTVIKYKPKVNAVRIYVDTKIKIRLKKLRKKIL